MDCIIDKISVSLKVTWIKVKIVFWNASSKENNRFLYFYKSSLTFFITYNDEEFKACKR